MSIAKTLSALFQNLQKSVGRTAERRTGGLIVTGQCQCVFIGIRVRFVQLLCLVQFPKRGVGRVHRRLVLLRHKLFHQCHGVGVDGLRRRLGNAALLNAHIDDVTHHVGQFQFQHCLAEQQQNCGQQEAQIWLHIPLQFQHV